MTDLTQDEARWQAWADGAARELGVDPGLVDIAVIHDLTRVIAKDLERPLAPVGSYLLGLAVGAQGPTADRKALSKVIEATIEKRSAN